MKFEEGQKIGSYTLLSFCGAGAYGQVFLAKNTMTSHKVALKILTLSDKIIARELQGLVNYRDCRHPNLLQIHHIEKFDDYLYYTMDAADNVGDANQYIPDTLAERLKKQKTLSVAEIIKMAEELLDGLTYLHKHGLVHRDIKPDNIFWIDGRATLGDIGLTSTIAGASLVGTPGFMSEDLLSGKRSATPEDDLYALGKVIYCALTGCAPKEYPHYPESVTISDAAPLIKTYTTVCQSESSIKTSEEMRELLHSGVSPKITPSSSNHYKKYLIYGAVFVGLVIFFLYLNGNDFVKEIEQSGITKGKINGGETEIRDLTIPADASIVSDLQLIYSNRNNAVLQKRLVSAREVIRNLKSEVQNKTNELNAHKMNEKNYLLAMNLIKQAEKDYLVHDPFCRLVSKEEEIQKFMKSHVSNLTEADVKLFKEMLDDREAILGKIEDSAVRK